VRGAFASGSSRRVRIPKNPISGAVGSMLIQQARVMAGMKVPELLT
jgi:hypothetical protein